VSDFYTQTFGKWILAGEHAVLRGSRALAFPLKARGLELRHSPSEGDLRVQTRGLQHEILHACAQSALERALELLDVGRSALNGVLLIVNRLPCGAGLGASAALCVAIARWLEARGLVSSGAIHEFARQLENLFHGESSGLDIAVALRERPVMFCPDSGASEFKPAWIPGLFLSDSGARSATRECVDKVKALLRQSPAEGESIDVDMRNAVDQCAESLRDNRQGACASLAEAINLACRCFRRWGLIEQRLADHMEDLMLAGASATKPTGAGIGGFALSLWSSPPPTLLRDRLIPCFAPAP
jgi:mevalonate kinase